MTMGWITMYAIVAMDTNPMYGHDETIEILDNKDLAIKKAKALSLLRNNICVEERRYASVENLIRGITFDQRICWACWL